MTPLLFAGAFILALFIVCIVWSILDADRGLRSLLEKDEWTDEDDALLDTHIRVIGGVYDHEWRGDFDA
jgi:hypothetical protein